MCKCGNYNVNLALQFVLFVAHRQTVVLHCIMLHYRELNLRAEEDRCSRLREELLTLREDLNKAYLSHDMLEQQKMESDGHIAQIEKNKGVLTI